MPKGPKGSKAIHPNSRKASAMSKKTHREVRLEKNQKDKYLKLERQAARLQWFHDNLEEDKKCYQMSEVCELIERYLGRFGEELEQIELANSIKGRKGLQHAAREQTIKVTMESERQEYESIGLEVPDLLSKENFKEFREWSGELKTMQKLKLRNVRPQKKSEKGEETTDENPSHDS